MQRVHSDHNHEMDGAVSLLKPWGNAALLDGAEGERLAGEIGKKDMLGTLRGLCWTKNWGIDNGLHKSYLLAGCIKW